MKHLIALAALLVIASGCSSSKEMSNASSASSALPSSLSAAAPMLDGLMKSVPGLSQAQAALGAGSMLGLAQGTMTPDQYAQVAKAVPGADALIANANKMGLPNPAKSVGDVSSFLQKSGISSTQVNQLGSALTGMIKGQVPGDVASNFANALGTNVATGE